MSWQNDQTSERREKQCKVRKRGCSSSSSSSLIRKYRFKRAILVAKRGGSSTPVPTWKMNSKSPSSKISSGEIPRRSPSFDAIKGKEPSVSARKLAATLWEINDAPPQKVKRSSELLQDVKKSKTSERIAKVSHPGVSDPDPYPGYHAVSERIEKSEGGRGRHQRRMSAASHKLHFANHYLEGLHSRSSASFMEIENHSHGMTHRKYIIGVRTRLKEVSNGLTTSKELLKALNHIWGLGDQHPSSLSLVSALKLELNRAQVEVDQLLKEQRSNRNEIEYLMRCFAEEKAAWKSKERDRIHTSIKCVSDELEVEKKLRRQAERLNKKLGKELADTKASLSKAMIELEREKRAKDIFEQICDELARGIGEDRAHVEELKKDAAKVREEVEKEREMLQIADVLREERVQMKLSEAKYQFEEKNAVVEKLKTELESYLKLKLSKDNDDESPKFEKIQELEAYLKEINFGSSQIIQKKEEEEEDSSSSADSDLHSIELNMDNNNKSYKWSFACEESTQDHLKRNPVEKEVKGRTSLSDIIQWGSICFNRGASNGKNEDFGCTTQENSDGFDWERFSELLSQRQTKDQDVEIPRYKSVNCIGDHTVSTKSFGCPTPQRGQS